MSPKSRNLIFVFAGIAGLLAKGRYSGPFPEAVRSFGGNVSVSFAVYFMLLESCSRFRHGRVCAAAAALAAVELFEATDGFGFMSNVYDPWDFAANAAGVGLAVAVDIAAARLTRRGRELRSAS